MTEAKHTPGPWGFEDPLGSEILSIVANPDAPPHETETDYDDGEDTRSLEEHEANARLIAAARSVPLHLMAQDGDEHHAAPEALALIRMGQIEEEGASHVRLPGA